MRLRFNRYGAALCLWIGGLIQATTQIVHSGHEVGNGGNVVDCGKVVELLDVYEARVLRKVEFIDPQAGDAYATARERLQLLAEIDPRSVEIYRKFLERLITDISFEKQLTLGPIDDSKHVFTPSDPACKVKQLAVLRKHPMPGEKRVLVAEPLWNRLSLRDQAGLLLHEVMYQHFAQLGEPTSVKVRYFVSLLLSKDFGPESRATYWAAVRKMKLPLYSK